MMMSMRVCRSSYRDEETGDEVLQGHKHTINQSDIKACVGWEADIVASASVLLR